MNLTTAIIRLAEIANAALPDMDADARLATYNAVAVAAAAVESDDARRIHAAAITAFESLRRADAAQLEFRALFPR